MSSSPLHLSSRPPEFDVLKYMALWFEKDRFDKIFIFALKLLTRLKSEKNLTSPSSGEDDDFEDVFVDPKILVKLLRKTDVKITTKKIGSNT